MANTISTSKVFRSWNIDKWVFILFIGATIITSLYFAHLSNQWAKPIFHEVSLEPNAPTITLNYSEQLDMLVLDKSGQTPLNISCLNVEEDLCGRGQPYAYNYEVEYINIAQVGTDRFLDQITYISNKTDVIELKTSLRSYAENKMQAYDKQRTVYIVVIGIIFSFYLAFRFFGYNLNKEDK